MNHLLIRGRGIRRHRRLLVAGVLAAGVLVGALGGRRAWRLEVVGSSMRPVLEPGDRVLVVRGARVRAGDLVAVVDPRRPGRTMVKRVAAAPGGSIRLEDGTVLAAGTGYIVLGDNDASTTDSRHFGPVDLDSIKGRVVYRYAPDSRRGPLNGRSRPPRW